MSDTPAQHRHLTRAEIVAIKEEFQLRAKAERLDIRDDVAIMHLINLCFHDAHLPAFARWALASCAHHLAPEEMSR